MSNKKNNENLQGKLTHADKERSADANSSAVNNSFIEKYTKTRGNVSSVFTKKKKFPIVLDILISLVLVLIVAALVVGAYFLIIRFNDSYDNATVEYVLLVDREVLDGLSKGDNVYVDKAETVVYLGNVVDIDKEVSVSNLNTTAKLVALTIRADVQYRNDEGYNIDGEKIAVGRNITIRINNKVLPSEIVELVIIEDVNN